MNASASSSQDIFDVRKIRRLVELMKEHDLSEIDLQQGDVRIQLRRAGSAVPTAVGVAPLQAVASPVAGPPAPESDRADRRSRRQGDRAGQKPDGRHVLRRPRSRFAAVCEGRRPHRPRHDRLHRRGHEGIQSDIRRGRGPHHRGAGRKRRAGGVRAASVQSRHAGSNRVQANPSCQSR